MKIMLDCALSKIVEYSKRYDYEFWQLRTPLTQYSIGNVPYGLDNGCFTEFKRDTWYKMLEEAEANRPVFVCLPDIVGDARRTLELFECFWHKTGGLPRCLVLQDGIGNHKIPWNDLDAVFIGGSDSFKISPEALNAAKVAKILGKWVHVGRVNTTSRVANWAGLADSIDGSGISRFDHMLESVVDAIKGLDKVMEQEAMDLSHANKSPEPLA